MGNNRVNRREFITALSAASAGCWLSGSVLAAQPAGKGLADTNVNLVPDAAGRAPSYYCSWTTQVYDMALPLTAQQYADLPDEELTKRSERALDEAHIFGPQGQAREFYPRLRGDLYFLFDDGWETGGTATFRLDETKFPSFVGNNLGRLNDAVRKLGWRGAAYWCSSPPGGEADRWIARLLKQYAVAYVKIDGGDTDFTLKKMAHELGAPTVFEHANGEPPLNGDWRSLGRVAPPKQGPARIEMLKGTDVYRTYDTTTQLAIPTTLDRIAHLLAAAQGQPEITALLNVDDEPYISAALGCTVSILRHPVRSVPPGQVADVTSNGPRDVNRRLDEVTRAVLWQRLAAPYSVGHGFVRLGDDLLTDAWNFAPKDTWYKEVVGHTAFQSAPARIARNLDLPEVTASGPKPFVLAARFPNGAVALATQGRMAGGNQWSQPRATVTLNLADASGPVGIFGRFEALTLVFDKPTAGQRFLAQDLAGTRAVDITRRVRTSGAKVTIPGEIIDGVGLADSTSDDISDPGLVLVRAGS